MSGAYLIGTGGGYVEILGVLYVITLLGFTSVINYWLSGIIAHFAKRGQTLVRTAVWSILFPLLFCLLEAKRSPVSSGSDGFFGSFVFALRSFFWYDPSFSLPYVFIPLGIWLIGVILIAREDFARAIQSFSKKGARV